MKADETRRSFDPFKHFSRVLMQQGRVQLDADWNEQAAIVLHLVRRLATHVFPNGGGSGFTISAPGSATLDFVIGAGDFWVDGILCELESTPVAVSSFDATQKKVVVTAWTVDEKSFAVGQFVTIDAADGSITPVIAQIKATTYATSTLTVDADLSTLPAGSSLRLRRLTTYSTQPSGVLDGPLVSNVAYQIYLDVWERLITCVEDDSIREVALNGLDTAARTQVVWQVRAWPFQSQPIVGRPRTKPPVTQSFPCMTQQALVAALQPAPSGLLQARTNPALQYRGSENQLYRVEIHTGRAPGTDSGPATFKWSRDNGSVVFPIVKVDAGNGTTEVVLGNLGRDDRFGLHIGDYVEIQDDTSVLSNTVGPLLQVQAIDRTELLVTLTGSTGTTVGSNPALHALVRRWDQESSVPQIVGDTWLDLEEGVQVRFPNGDAAFYRTGDYWQIPARVAIGDITWPTEINQDTIGDPIVIPIAKLPDGVAHHYLPLAVFDGTVSPPAITSCVDR